MADPVTPHLNWKKQLPRKPNEDEQRAFESLYTTNPVTGEKMLDYRQLNYKYEVYDYTTAALRRNRLNPDERNLNTDVTINPNEVVMISKDTAFVDDEGRIVRQTITDAIAEYEKTLLTPDSPFDQYLKGNKEAMTASPAKVTLF